MHKRSRFIILIAIILLGLGLANVWRFFGLNAQRSIFSEYGTAVSPIVLMSLAIIWALVFIGLGVALWRGWARAKFVIPAAIAVYAIMYLILPTPNVPTLYWHIFLILLSAIALRNYPRSLELDEG